MTYSEEPVNGKDDAEGLLDEVLEESVEDAPDLGAFEMTPEPEYTEILDNVHEDGNLTDSVVVPSVETLDDDIIEYVPPVEVKEEGTTIPPKEAKEAPQSPPAPKKSHKWQYIALFTALLLIIGGSFAVIYLSFGGEIYTSDNKVAVIYVQGVMLTGNLPSGFGYATSEDVCNSLREAAADEGVKAIVLRVNSGGGSPAAAEEIITEIENVQAQGIPVVVSMGDVAASAAYHISAPADLILANPSTITGSIGVIGVYTNRSEYYDNEGIDFYISKSGEFKDMGGDWRGLTSEEKEYADTVVLKVYDLFITSVAEHRNMTKSEVKDIADGRVYIAVEAKEIGLIDDFGNLYDAIDAAAELGGIEGEPSVYYINRPSLSSILFGSEETFSTDSVEQLVSYYKESPVGTIVE
ncbi:signal peptide peptidase A. Serine peptidase. MEROPS family S49 [Methanococcoides vulcani]|uniref:Signal peptide peptidase A. Serine peptidase. MEROPS family S49 n=1 Tax=Methanococcoides vulcani TaxID=1353158 RepID=A0A1H9Z1Q3_9EURY|nr:signal peptide peptidase SppA [Methanococcoides vulcani]SES75444.1 signal peptide peptidase A. Serine peptidase. MEROPS family S49 [Methanococcoides vulcani]